MKILVVHDRAEVRDRVVRILEGGDFSNDVVSKKSYVEARDQLIGDNGSFFDLLILDLTLPLDKYDNRIPTVENAQNLLTEIFSGSDFIAPGDVIGISNDLPSIEKTERMFSESVLVILNEAADSDWEAQLQAKLEYLSKSRKSRVRSEFQQHDIDVLIVTALDIEAVPYENIFSLEDRDPKIGVRNFLFTDKGGDLRRGALYSIGKPGQSPAASETQALLIRYRPRFAFMSGFCGGVRERVNLCDVISFEMSFSWDSGKWTKPSGGEPTFQPRPQPIEASVEYFDDILRDWCGKDPLSDSMLRIDAGKLCEKSILESPKFHRKHAGSGSAVVNEEEVIHNIRDLNEEIWAVDMESHGFYYACKHTRTVKPKFLCVKAIADFCDSKKNDKMHATCSFLSANVIRSLMTGFISIE